MSYGIQKNSFQNSSVDSYALPLVIVDETTKIVFTQILDKCKEHLNISAINNAFAMKEFFIEEMDTFYKNKAYQYCMQNSIKDVHNLH